MSRAWVRASLSVWGVLATSWLGADEASGQITTEVGRPEVVFDGAADGCTAEDIPDIPTRAWVDAEGQVHLINGHFELYESVGPNLDGVRRRCDATVFHSNHDADPAHLDDVEWLHATWTDDGETVHGLVHMEYHGWEHGACDSAEVFNCWWNAITSARSNDGGRSFVQTEPFPHGVVLPVSAYDRAWTQGPAGFFNPSNIIHHQGWLYTLYQAEPHGTQPWGTCVMRTPDIADPTAWRAWGGAGFDVDPRGDGTQGPGCAVVSRDAIQKMRSYVTYNTYLERFLLVGPATIGGRHGLAWSVSDDLIHWEPATLLLESELFWTGTANDIKRGYPATLQPGDPTRNFEQTDRAPWLYVTEWRPADGTYARRLVRRRIRLSKPGDANRHTVLALELNERAGTESLDSGFYGNDARLDGSARFSAERATGPSSIDLDGNGRLVVADAESLRLDGSMSLEAFVRLRTLPRDHFPVLVAKDGGPTTRNFGLYLAPASASRPGALHLSGSSPDGYRGVLGVRNLADDRWHHVAATWDLDERVARLYVDGALDSAEPLDITPSLAHDAAPVVLGDGLDGWLDSVRVHDHVRTAAELRASGRGSGQVELCNGQDDTGDGVVDEGCPGGPPIDVPDAGDAEVDTHADAVTQDVEDDTLDIFSCEVDDDGFTSWDDPGGLRPNPDAVEGDSPEPGEGASGGARPNPVGQPGACACQVGLPVAGAAWLPVVMGILLLAGLHLARRRQQPHDQKITLVSNS